ncbi:hypothetical protein FJZ17_00350 [Candidatus Pacearchaeota archaeon]|nr:hypothetical protein [Candidatus Pacearchaeota archaeon]
MVEDNMPPGLETAALKDPEEQPKRPQRPGILAVQEGQFYVDRLPNCTDLWIPAEVLEKLGEQRVVDLATGIYQQEFIRPKIRLLTTKEGYHFLFLPCSRDPAHIEWNHPGSEENPRYDLPDILVEKLREAIGLTSAGTP